MARMRIVDKKGNTQMTIDDTGEILPSAQGDGDPGEPAETDEDKEIRTFTVDEVAELLNKAINEQ